jgi:predicted O-methyltransferase YrrM
MGATIDSTVFAYAEDFLDDLDREQPSLMRSAHDRALDLGIGSLSNQSSSLLELLAASIQAQAIIEVGTGVGVSGAALLAGMTPGGVLTSIDLEAEYQRYARELFESLGHSHQRTRLIAGRALDVLPRFSDGAYDMVVADSDPSEFPAILHQAKRLLRIGGLVVFNSVFDSGMADPSVRDFEAIAVRDCATALRNDDDWLPALLTVGQGMLIGSLRARDLKIPAPGVGREHQKIR